MADTPQDEVPNQVAQVQPDIRAPANLTPADFGASVGQAVEEAGGRFQREEVWANQSAVMAATNQLSDYTNQTVYDAKTGIAHQELGADAPGAVKGVLDDHAAKISEINDGLSNDAQRKMFAAHAAEHMRGVDRSLNGYEAEQMHGYNNQQTEAFVKNTSLAAIRASMDPAPAAGAPDPVKVRVEQVRAAIQLQASANHQAPALTELQVNNAISGIHQGVVEQQISAGQIGRAQSYFDANKDEIDPREARRLSDTLTLAQDRDQSLSLAHSVFLDPKTGDPRNPIDIEASVSKAAGDNTKLYDNTMRRVNELGVIYKNGQEAMQQQAAQRANQVIDKTRGDMTKVDPNDLQIMGYANRKSLEKYSEQLTSGQLTPDNSETFQVLSKFAGQAAADPNAMLPSPYGPPTTLAKMNPNVYRADMSDKNFAQLLGWIKEAQGKKTSGGDDMGLSGQMTKAQIFNNALASANIPKPELFDKQGKPNQTPEAKQYIRLSQIVEARMEADGGWAKVGGTGLRKILNEELANITVNTNRNDHSHIPGSVTEVKHQFELEPEGKVYSSREIPADKLDEIKRAATENGGTITEARLVNAYNNSLNRQ